MYFVFIVFLWPINEIMYALNNFSTNCINYKFKCTFLVIQCKSEISRFKYCLFLHLTERAVELGQDMRKQEFKDQSWLGLKTRSRDATLSRHKGININELYLVTPFRIRLNIDFHFIATHVKVTFSIWRGQICWIIKSKYKLNTRLTFL